MSTNNSILSKLSFLKKRIISKIITLNKIFFSKIFNLEIVIHYKDEAEIKYEKIRSNKDLTQRAIDLETIYNLPEYKNLKTYILYDLYNTQILNVDSTAFLTVKKYFIEKENWKKVNKLTDLNLDILLEQLFTGSLGNYIKPYEYIESQKYGLAQKKKAIFCMPIDNKITNEVLFSYFEEHINIIHNNDLIKKINSLERSPLNLPLGHVLEIDGDYIYPDLAYNYIIQKKHNLGKKYDHLFKLKNNHFEEGWKALKNYGLSEKNWWVTIHVRDGNTKNDHDTEFWRNSDINKFQDSIKYIESLGGIVFRMGDNKMPKMKENSNIIDYAHSSLKSPLMDVFLGALSKFHLGTDSGYPIIPKMFGVPSLLCETSSYPAYFALNSYDVFLPRLYRNKNTQEYIKFKDASIPPYSIIWFDVRKMMQKMNLELIENTTKDILSATKLLYEISQNNKNPPHDTPLQKKFKDSIENTNEGYYIPKLKPYGNIPNEFLEKYRDLI